MRASREELEQLTGALNALAAEERGLRRKKEALEAELSAISVWPSGTWTGGSPRPGGAGPGPGGPGRTEERAGPVRAHPPQGGAEAGPGGAGLSESPGAGDQTGGGGPGPGGGGAGAGPDRRPGRPLSRTDGGGGRGVRQKSGGGVCRGPEKRRDLVAHGQAGPGDRRAGGRGHGGAGPGSGGRRLLSRRPHRGSLLVFTLALGVFNHSQARRSRAWGDQVLDRFSVKTRRNWRGCWRTTGPGPRPPDQAAQQVRLVREGLSDRKARRENSRKDLFDFVHSFAPEVKDLFGCSAALSRALNLGERRLRWPTQSWRGPAAVRCPESSGGPGGGTRGPGTGGPPAHHGGDRRPAGHRPGRPGAHRPGPEHGPGPSEGGGGPCRRPGRPARRSWRGSWSGAARSTRPSPPP